MLAVTYLAIFVYITAVLIETVDVVVAADLDGSQIFFDDDNQYYDYI